MLLDPQVDMHYDHSTNLHHNFHILTTKTWLGLAKASTQHQKKTLGVRHYHNEQYLRGNYVYLQHCFLRLLV